jgi:RecB family exonuclease
LRARFRRWRRTWSSADGLVEPNEAARTVLDEHRLNHRSYSPTALQQFASCPYKFFLYAIQRLQPREERAAIEKLDPLTRGALFHEAQFDIIRGLERDAILPLGPAGLPHALDLADTVLNALDGKYAEELAPAIPGVWSTEIEDIRTDLRGWIRHLAEAAPGWIPIHAEFAFGMRAEEKRDPASRTEEAVILDGVRLRGSVDLIEKHAARDVLRVTDHKTGKAPSPPPLHIGGGRMLQPFLYSLAVEQLLETPVEMARLFHCTQRGNFTDLHMAVKEIGRHAIRLALGTIDLHVADGFLPAAPTPDACRLCDYRAVCGPYEETRVRRKSQPELEQLNRLRLLP